MDGLDRVDGPPTVDLMDLTAMEMSLDAHTVCPSDVITFAPRRPPFWTQAASRSIPNPRSPSRPLNLPPSSDHPTTDIGLEYIHHIVPIVKQ